MHKFNRYRMSHFYEISSANTKFDTVNRFCKDIKKLRMSKAKEGNMVKENNCVKKCVIVLLWVG